MFTKAQLKSYRPQTAILASGQASKTIFLLIKGHVQAFALSIDGRQILVESFAKGSVFGESSLVGEDLTAHEAVAIDAVWASLFATHVFIALMENYSCIALTMSRILTARLQATSRQMIEIATLSAPGRVHAELLRQARQGKAMTITPAPVLAEFAVTVRSTRETVSRTISLLEKRGIIRRDKNGLTIIAPHRIEELIY